MAMASTRLDSSDSWKRTLDSSARSDPVLIAPQPGARRWPGGDRRAEILGHRYSGCFRMLSRLDLRGFTGDLASVLTRPEPGGEEPLATVREIISEVRKRGDDAVRDFTVRFDGYRLEELRVPRGDLTAALATVPPTFREALEFA